MGRPCVFIRLTYCNLRCTYCDTEYAFTEGRSMSVDEILHTVDGFGCNFVEVTGGEPLMQAGVNDLLAALCDRGYQTLVETGGSLDISRFDRRARMIVDFKTPASGMEKKNLWSNVTHLRAGDEVKFVIGDRADFDWAVARMKEHELDGRCPVLMSVVFGLLEPARLAEWILESRIDVRFQLQMHKYIWEPLTRGV